mmetsp:Transcript_96348/g.281507  ORF Transcript_96348/g.281507 Transcript_96348/m.281507 type:complete len:201 (-) Transcript_96348:505-1107(-)
MCGSAAQIVQPASTHMVKTNSVNAKGPKAQQKAKLETRRLQLRQTLRNLQKVLADSTCQLPNQTQYTAPTPGNSLGPHGSFAAHVMGASAPPPWQVPLWEASMTAGHSFPSGLRVAVGPSTAAARKTLRRAQSCSRTFGSCLLRSLCSHGSSLMLKRHACSGLSAAEPLVASHANPAAMLAGGGGHRTVQSCEVAPAGRA